MDRGAWRATVCGVVVHDLGTKQLKSSKEDAQLSVRSGGLAGAEAYISNS